MLELRRHDLHQRAAVYINRWCKPALVAARVTGSTISAQAESPYTSACRLSATAVMASLTGVPVLRIR